MEMMQNNKEQTPKSHEDLKPSIPVTYDEKQALIKAYLEGLKTEKPQKPQKPRKKRTQKVSE